MECSNTHCMWNSFGQCCPEDEQQYKNAVPNTLDCPSSLRVDFQQRLMHLVGECEILISQRNMKELIQIKKFIESQRKEGNKMTTKLKGYKVPKQIEKIGVTKEMLFKSWVEELGYDKAVLLSCGYNVEKVVKMTAEDAENEVQAIE